MPRGFGVKAVPQMFWCVQARHAREVNDVLVLATAHSARGAQS